MLTPQQLAEAREFERVLTSFQEELTQVTVLDPACGSGNFLYVALKQILDLEKEVITYGASNGLALMFPRVRPSQLLGLEVNQYAQELTQVVIWIGYLQWMRDNGFPHRRDPILGDMDNIRLQDALLDLSDPAHPKEAAWPPADYIIGNPPFLGGYKLREELGSEYYEDLIVVFKERVPGSADLCCYFHEKARAEIEGGGTARAGLLATNSIRGGANRQTLRRIKSTGDIFMAWGDEEWVLDGAAVRISIVGFDDGSESDKSLDGEPIESINSDLTGAIDITSARQLPGLSSICFRGYTKGGSFDITREQARAFLALPVNPNGRPNSDVVKPWVNGREIAGRCRGMWIIDFGVDLGEHEAALYEAPFEYVRQHVKPLRDGSRRDVYREKWWIHMEPRPALRQALAGLSRYIVTPMVARHRLFVWLDIDVVPDQQLEAV